MLMMHDFGADSIMMDHEDLWQCRKKCCETSCLPCLKESIFGGSFILVRINTMESGLGQAR